MDPYTIIIDGNKITFTTDASEFKRELEIGSCMDRLKENFDLSNFEVHLHTHPGEKKDKDVSFRVKNKGDLEKIVDFIKKEFYKK